MLVNINGTLVQRNIVYQHICGWQKMVGEINPKSDHSFHKCQDSDYSGAYLKNFFILIDRYFTNFHYLISLVIAYDIIIYLLKTLIWTARIRKRVKIKFVRIDSWIGLKLMTKNNFLNKKKILSNIWKQFSQLIIFSTSSFPRNKNTCYLT